MYEKTVCYEFDNVRVDPRAFKVWREGALLPVEPKAFEVLVFLINHRGLLVEKDELLNAVWKEAFVTPNALTRVIAHLRKLLGDDARDARYIETVPTRGYRFIAEVEVKSDRSETPESNQARVATYDPAEPIAAIKPDWWKSFPARLLVPASAIALLLAVAVIVWRGRDATESVSILKTTQITASPLMDIHPAFSPDGGAIAYSSLRNGGFEIFVKQLAPGSREIQITSDGGENIQPAWSPDGKMLAFCSRRRAGLWTVPALGGVARQIVGFGADPAHSPDGEWIVFQSDAPVDLSQAGFGAMPPSTLWIVPARGGQARQITQKGAPRGGHGAPSWSPDGKRIVFVTNDIPKAEIWTVAPDGKDLTLLRGEMSRVYDPVYSPDGNYLYVVTGASNFQLWRTRVSPVTGLPIGEPVAITNTGAALARHLTVAPDGKRIAYSALMMSSNIGSITISRDNHTATGVPALLTQDTNRRKTAPNFSPDGKTIVYSIWRAGIGGEVWLMDADGGNPRQLTADLAGLPNWMSDGERVAIVSKGQPGPRLWAVNVKSGRQEIISEQVFKDGMGKLSPDGAQFAFNSTQSGTLNTWMLPVAGGPAKQLTFDQELMGFPCWSRDGKFLAVEVKRGDDTHVVTMPSAGGASTQLTNDPGQSWPGSWSQDGDKIAFAGLRDGHWNIWWVSRSTRRQQQVTDLRKPNVYVRYPSWSPLGNQIVYEYAENTGNVWIMELK